jgi:hypothetical protein
MKGNKKKAQCILICCFIVEPSNWREHFNLFIRNSLRSPFSDMRIFDGFFVKHWCYEIKRHFFLNYNLFFFWWVTIKYGDYVRYLHFPLDFLRWSLTSGFPSADIAGGKRRFRNCFLGRKEVPRDSQNDRCIHSEVLRHMLTSLPSWTALPNG